MPKPDTDPQELRKGEIIEGKDGRLWKVLANKKTGKHYWRPCAYRDVTCFPDPRYPKGDVIREIPDTRQESLMSRLPLQERKVEDWKPHYWNFYETDYLGSVKLFEMPHNAHRG